MKILAIDTSTTLASVAYFEKNTIYEKSINNPVTHSEKLLTIVDLLLKEHNTLVSDIDLFASTMGPGSFTGIRIGISTIKAFAHVNNAKIYGRSTLDILSVPYLLTHKYVCTMLNAKNENVYYALYTLENNILINVIIPKFNNVTIAFNDILNSIDISKCIFVGSGATQNFDILNTLNANINIAKENELPNAKNLIELLKLEKDKDNNKYIHNYDEFKPIYLRLSQAERNCNDK